MLYVVELLATQWPLGNSYPSRLLARAGFESWEEGWVKKSRLKTHQEDSRCSIVILVAHWGYRRSCLLVRDTASLAERGWTLLDMVFQLAA